MKYMGSKDTTKQKHKTLNDDSRTNVKERTDTAIAYRECYVQVFILVIN